MTQSQVHILVVDDERNIRNNLAMVLEAEGYKVDKASNGDDALLQVKAGLYDIVFVDIQMPKMDGFELYESIREKDKITKICFLTASEMFYESLRKARNLFGNTLGEEYFIQKPAKSDQLVRQLNDIINSPQKQPST